MPGIELLDTPIKGLTLGISTGFQDERGSFTRLFCKDQLKEVLNGRSIVQIDLSKNGPIGLIRGLHLQLPPHGEMKLVRCVAGKVYDVAVDLRQGSPTFMKYEGYVLTPESSKMLIIPEGFAHGFQVLEENSQVLYFVTEFFHPESEFPVNALDPGININWPLPVGLRSQKDQSSDFLPGDFKGVAC